MCGSEWTSVPGLVNVIDHFPILISSKMCGLQNSNNDLVFKCNAQKVRQRVRSEERAFASLTVVMFPAL